MRRLLICIMASVCVLVANAQNDRQNIREGNRQFHKQDYAKADVAYRKALAQNANNTQAMYNLGCALMAQQKDSAAIEQLEKAGKAEKAKMRKAKVYHNIGWICQRHQMYSEAIEAYKESLRNNPNDNETRYNLALCKRQQKNQNKNNDKNNKNDKNKDKKNKQDKQNKNEQDKQQKPEEKMSKDNAEQLLNAAVQQEKETQQRLKKAMSQPQSKQLQKNW